MPKSKIQTIQKIVIDFDYSTEKSIKLIEVLKQRYQDNLHRHQDISWEEVSARLITNESSLITLWNMEQSGGEPDVIGIDSETNKIIFCDCSKESPQRRSICYDQSGEDLRKNKGVFPAGNAQDLATQIGISILNEFQYRKLQEIEDFDTKTSSWIQTPQTIRELGGALFCDRRYGTVFTYHNSAESFYSARGFRGMVLI